jgi:hypothetical protein
MEYVSCGRAAVQRLLTPGETVIEGWPAVNTVPMRVRGGERESTTVAGPPSAGGRGRWKRPLEFPILHTSASMETPSDCDSAVEWRVRVSIEAGIVCLRCGFPTAGVWT